MNETQNGQTGRDKKLKRLDFKQKQADQMLCRLTFKTQTYNFLQFEN